MRDRPHYLDLTLLAYHEWRASRRPQSRVRLIALVVMVTAALIGLAFMG